jgi:hypothetical protein
MENIGKICLDEKGVSLMVKECVNRCLAINEDMTRGQVENQIENFIKSKDFEKRIHNIAVDVISEFFENMWLKKSFWKTIVKKK